MKNYTVPLGGVDKICPLCGKTYNVPNPGLWRHRDGYTFYCSDKCHRKVWPKPSERILAELEGKIYRPKKNSRRKKAYESA